MQSETTASQIESPRESSERELIDAMGKFYANPYGFVMFAYHDYWEHLRQQDPEKVLGAGPNAGPDQWQIEILLEIGKEVERVIRGEKETAVRFAVKSGHGVGKTSLMAWINHWFMSTRPHPQSVATANTKTQLESKTWRELGRWWERSIHKHWFEYTATKFALKAHTKTWFSEAVPWSKEKPEAFMGTHEKYVLMIFDESSAIEDCIWEAAEGAMTTTGAMWFAFGNPTRAKGKFIECWGVQRNRWKTFTVSAQDAKMSNKNEINEWLEIYGKDSDFCRVKIFGLPPSVSSLQFISEDLVKRAFDRHPDNQAGKHETGEVQLDPPIYQNAPIVLGVDIARHGDDKTVIVARQGLYLHPKIIRVQIPDLTKVGDLIIQQIKKYHPAATFIDAGGMGWGVIDYLNKLGYRITPVDGATKPIREKGEYKYLNKRSEMWATGKKWLQEGGAMPENEDLMNDATGIEFSYDMQERLVMEKKESMKLRGLASPDVFEAVLQTFAVPLGPDAREDMPASRQKTALMDYDEFSQMDDPLM